MLSHSNVMHNAKAVQLWNCVRSDSRVLLAVPMFHVTGMVGVMHAGIMAGVMLVLMPRWDREAAAALIERWKITHWSNIPTMVIDMMGSPNRSQVDLSSLVDVGGGGAAMPQAIARRLLQRTGLRYVAAYGPTETAAPSHSNPRHAPKQQCLGIPFVGVDSKIIDPVALIELPAGQTGEIVVHGPQVFGGYWNQPQASAESFVELSGKAYLRTGDIGHVDADGYFFLTDRLMRMINASGFKVWPAEVEALRYRHPAVQEACVIAARDSYRGESVKAVIVLKASHRSVSELEIIDWCRQNMAADKIPRSVLFAEALPKSGAGKVMWRALQETEAAEFDASTER